MYAMDLKVHWWLTSSNDAWCRAPIGVSKAMRRWWWWFALVTETTSRSCRSIIICPTLRLRHRWGNLPRSPQPNIALKNASNAVRAKPGWPTMRCVIGRAGTIIKRCRYWRHGSWSGKRTGGKKWTPAMTFPQIRQGIALILREVFQCGTMSHMLEVRQKRLRRNELARFYHWKRHNLLAPLNLHIRLF